MENDRLRDSSYERRKKSVMAEWMLADDVGCLKRGKTEFCRSMEMEVDESEVPEMFTFHVALSQSTTYYRWREIGAKQQLATDEDIACFLLECYEKDLSSLSATCKKCQGPLKLVCSQCSSQITMNYNCLLGRDGGSTNFPETGNTSHQQSNQDVLKDAELLQSSPARPKTKLKTNHKRKATEEKGAFDAIVMKLEADRPSPTGPTLQTTTHQPDLYCEDKRLTTLSAASNRMSSCPSSAVSTPVQNSEDSHQDSTVDDERDTEFCQHETKDRWLSASEESNSSKVMLWVKVRDEAEERGREGDELKEKCSTTIKRSSSGPVDERNNDIVNLVCLLCYRAMASKRSLLYHMGSQHPDAPLPACIAHLSSGRKGEDEMVRQARMEKAKARLKRRVELASLTCGTCGKKFENKVKMSSHLKQCTWKVCDLCGKSVKDLDMHLKRHVAPKRFQCPHCPKVYLFKTYLDTHLLYHNRERPFCCEVCGARYYERFRLTAHIRTHTGVKPFKCDQCDACFTRKRGLSDHVRVHTGEKPYGCQVCGRQFSSTGNLAAHRRKVHKMEPQVACPARPVLSAGTPTTTTAAANTSPHTNGNANAVAETAAKCERGLLGGSQRIEA